MNPFVGNQRLEGPDYLSLVIEWTPLEGLSSAFERAMRDEAEFVSEIDIVEEASQTTPASDSPGWLSSGVAAPLAELADPSAIDTIPIRALSPLRAHLKQIAVAVAAVGALIGIALTWRRVRTA